MDAVFAFKAAVGVGAGDFVDGGFNAGFFPSSALHECGLEAVFLAKSQIHALEHTGPVHGFGAANAGGDA